MQFEVHGVPKAQARARAFARKVGGRYIARVYDAGTAENWKALVASAAKPMQPSVPLEGPIGVQVLFALPRPKGRCRKRDPAGPIWCTTRPDSDNLAKAVVDCLTQLGWWHDDAQIVSLLVSKMWHGKEGRPGAMIRIYQLPADEGRQ